MAPELSTEAEVLSSSVPKGRKPLGCLMEKIRVLIFCHHELIVLLTLNSVLMNQQNILSKVSLNRNTYRTRAWIEPLTKIL